MIVKLKIDLKQKEFEISNQIVLINDLQTQLSKINAEIKQNQSKITSIQGETTKLCNENVHISNEIENIKKLIDENKKITQTKSKNNQKLKRKIDKYQKFLTELTSHQRSYKAQSYKTEKSFQKYNLEINSLIEQIRILQNENAELSKKYELKQNIRNEKIIMANRMDILNRKYTGVYNQIESLVQQVNQRELMKNQLENTLNDLKNQEYDMRAIIDQQNQQYVNESYKDRR